MPNATNFIGGLPNSGGVGGNPTAGPTNLGGGLGNNAANAPNGPNSNAARFAQDLWNGGGGPNAGPAGMAGPPAAQPLNFVPNNPAGAQWQFSWQHPWSNRVYANPAFNPMNWNAAQNMGQLGGLADFLAQNPDFMGQWQQFLQGQNPGGSVPGTGPITDPNKIPPGSIAPPPPNLAGGAGGNYLGGLASILGGTQAPQPTVNSITPATQPFAGRQQTPGGTWQPDYGSIFGGASYAQ